MAMTTGCRYRAGETVAGQGCDTEERAVRGIPQRVASESTGLQVGVYVEGGSRRGPGGCGMQGREAGRREWQLQNGGDYRWQQTGIQRSVVGGFSRG